MTWPNIYKNLKRIDYCVDQFDYVRYCDRALAHSVIVVTWSEVVSDRVKGSRVQGRDTCCIIDLVFALYRIRPY